MEIADYHHELLADSEIEIEIQGFNFFTELHFFHLFRGMIFYLNLIISYFYLILSSPQTSWMYDFGFCSGYENKVLMTKLVASISYNVENTRREIMFI